MEGKFVDLIERLKKERSKRKIYVWGAWKTGEKYVKQFMKEGINIAGVIDSKRVGKMFGIKIVKPMFLMGKKDIFVFVSLVEHAEVRKILEEYGYVKGRDYLYEGDGVCIQSLKSEIYKDYFGNQIEGYLENSLVKLRACGKLKIGRNVKIGKNVKITVRDFSKLIIGDNVVLSDNVVINVSDASILKIGDNVSVQEESKIEIVNNSIFHIYKGCFINERCNISVVDSSRFVLKTNCTLGKFLNMIVMGNAETKCGKNTTIGFNNIIRVYGKTKFKCGDDCMVSNNVSIRGNNGHSIFSGGVIKQTKENVLLGNHVWVGMESILMPGTEIGDCSIVGASTLVNQKILPHCLVVGTPCRILEEDVDWSRRKNIAEEEFMEEVKNRDF